MMKLLRSQKLKFFVKLFRGKVCRVLNVQWTFVQHRPKRSVDWTESTKRTLLTNWNI